MLSVACSSVLHPLPTSPSPSSHSPRLAVISPEPRHQLAVALNNDNNKKRQSGEVHSEPWRWENRQALTGCLAAWPANLLAGWLAGGTQAGLQRNNRLFSQLGCGLVSRPAGGMAAFRSAGHSCWFLRFYCFGLRRYYIKDQVACYW